MIEFIKNFESELFLGLFEFKNKNYIKAKEHFNNLKTNFDNSIIFSPLKISLINWSDIMISNNIENLSLIETMPDNFGSFKSIQKIFASCYFDKDDLDKEFTKIIEDESGKFYRYNFFLTDCLIDGLKKADAKIISSDRSKYRSPIITAKFKNKDSESMINDLRYAKIFVSQRKEWVRFSPHFYNTLDDIEFVISEIRKKL